LKIKKGETQIRELLYSKTLSYELFEGVFKLIDRDDYRTLPSHNNHLIMKQAFGDWDSLFCALREYNIRVIPMLGVYIIEVLKLHITKVIGFLGTKKRL
jgi:hypothetical protein